MTDVDLPAARRGIDQLPWIDDVTVARAWPGTIRIRVTERVPVSAVEAGQGGWLLVDREGRLLERVDARPPEVVALEDVAKAGEVGEVLPAADADALLVARSVPPSLIGRVVAVAPAAEGGIELRLDDGARVLLGAPTPLEAKMLAVATVLGQVDGHCMATLDVRVPGNPVLTRTPGCA
jgi:cell division protein FtsQ